VAGQAELEYLFRHALVQDAAYGSLLKQDRRQLHRAVGQALEQLYPEQLGEQAATLAYHFEQAEVRDKAIHYFTLAGGRAKNGYANTEAMAFYRAAINQLEQILSQSAEPEKWRAKSARLFENLADVLELTGQHEAARQAYEQALAAMAQLARPDRIEQARIHRKIGSVLTVMHQFEQAQQVWDLGETALGQPPAGPALPELAHPWWQEWIEIQVERTWNRYWQGDTEGMERLCEKVLPVMQKYGTYIQRARVLTVRMLAGLRRERYLASDETAATGQEALTSALTSGNLVLITDAHFGLGLTYLPRCDLDRADEHLRAALELTERTGDAVRKSRCLAYLMLLARMRGQVAETRGYIPQVLSTAGAGHVNYTYFVKASLAWIAWHEGHLSEAREQGRESLELTQAFASGSPFKWTALWPLIGVALEEQNISEAIEYARDLFQPMQMRQPDALKEMLEAAIAASEQIQMEEARTQLERAMKLAQEMGYL
jgi:tetratricopeptide (TPR) repeat protein